MAKAEHPNLMGMTLDVPIIGNEMNKLRADSK